MLFNPQPKSRPTKLKTAAWRKRREEVFQRDGYICQCCGRPFRNEPDKLHPHHVKLKSQGGGDELENVISMCFRCHRKLHDGRLTQDEQSKYWRNVRRIS